jgi:hypothetical protein
MPLAFIIIGALVIVTAYKGTYKQFGSQLATDFTGSGNFIYWVAAVGIIGMAGYVKAIRAPARAFLGLVVLAFFISNKGVFAQFTSALSNYQPTQGGQAGEPAAPGALPIQIIGGTGTGTTGALGGLLGGITKLFGGAATGGAGGVAG